jgi:ribosomal protein L7/L12
LPKEPITESEIKGLTLLEASRLVKLLQEQLGVAASAAAPTSGREGEVPIEPASYRALSELQELATTWAADNIPTQELKF